MVISRESRRDQPQWLAQNAEENFRYRQEQAFEALYMDRQAAHEVPTDALAELYNFAAATIGDVPLLYLEFGVFEGRTIAQMADRFPHPDACFVGFDSFEGLPDDWVLPWATMARGTFSTKGRLPAITDRRVSFIKGWFQDTLPPFLSSGKMIPAGSPVLVHFDADLYGSTLFILAMLWQYIPEYYFIFDEYLGHEQIALYDFAQAFR